MTPPFNRPQPTTHFRQHAWSSLGWGLLFFAGCQLAFRLLLHWQPQIADREYGSKLAALRHLETENATLRRIVADQAIELRLRQEAEDKS